MRWKFSVLDAADHAADAIAFVEQQLREVAAVLAGDPGDECGLGHVRRPWLGPKTGYRNLRVGGV